ncbi:uncharacterized protein LOC127725574 [Mytilus californianus]|uniref:uncharacterized protein LOC127725574 n=1 Tax=Mytilus californianus TaxID=6549 RepID=UPI002247BDD6|nr:uncharacterized protein LOC127725574 [Mytilus californianus]
MTKGELSMAPRESGGTNIDQELSGRMVPDALNNYLPSNEYMIQGDKEILYSGYEIQKDSGKHSFPYSDETNNNNIGDCQINIAEYVQNLPDGRVRRKLAKALSTDEPDENLDIENMDHYLLVAKRSNLHNTLKCCENKLISNLNAVNCDAYYKLAEEYALRNLQSEALSIIKKTEKLDECSNFTNQNNNFSIEGGEVCNNQCCNSTRGSVGSSRTKNYKNYYSLFTCGSCGSKRTITTIVFDSNMRKRCYRDIKKGNNISKPFQCCCIQGDENNPPIVYWSFGSSVYQYDPLLNKCKKRASLYCKRAKFNMISHGNHCYVVGGVYMSRKVLEIEEYNTKKDSWKKVAYLPGDSLPLNPSCVVFDGLIYIFSDILDIQGNRKTSATAVYVFHPSTKTVKQVAEIPYSFKQMKTCVVDSFIYIASDRKHFIRFCPSDGSHLSLPDQTQECKDFGMFTIEKSIILAGGDCRGTEYKDIHVFCTVSGHWETLSEKLPDDMAIYGACELKIPNSAGTIVPFYETNLFEKR